MSTEIQKYDSSDRLSIQQVRDNVNLLQEVMRGVMQEGTHYGKIPGCGPKPTLLKPGAEKISSTFRLYPDVEILSEVDTATEYTVKVRVKLVHGPSGQFCGSGIGACSSLEEKYGWKEATCQDEYDAALDTMRRIKWKKGYNGPAEQTMQVRTEPKTQMNTVIKMAKKRAYVDAVLSATAASDIFTQDIEDMDFGAPSVSKKASPAEKKETKAGRSDKERIQKGIHAVTDRLALFDMTITENTFVNYLTTQYGIDTLEKADLRQITAIYKELATAGESFFDIYVEGPPAEDYKEITI